MLIYRFGMNKAGSSTDYFVKVASEFRIQMTSVRLRVQCRLLEGTPDRLRLGREKVICLPYKMIIISNARGSMKHQQTSKMSRIMIRNSHSCLCLSPIHLALYIVSLRLTSRPICDVVVSPFHHAMLFF